MKHKYAVGADIGGSHICSSVIDLATGETVRGTVRTKEVDSKAQSAGEILSVWSGCIAESVTGSGVTVSALGMAVPGPFDYDRGISLIESVDKYDAIFGLDVTGSLLPRLCSIGITEIKYVNDAAALALGETLGGAAKGIKRVMVLTLGTGLGSGFIAHGRLVTTGDCVPPNGWVYNLPFEGGIADDMFTTRWFLRKYCELTGKTVQGVKEIAEAAATDHRAMTVFDDYGRRLVDFMLPLCEKFGAGCVVLGGNIARAYPLFGESMDERLSELGKRMEIRTSSLGAAAAMTGAASLFTEN